MNEYTDYDDTVRERRLERIREMQRRKKQQMVVRRYIRRFAPLAAGLVLVVGLLISGGKRVDRSLNGNEASEQTESVDITQKEAADKVTPGSRILAIQTQIEAGTAQVRSQAVAAMNAEASEQNNSNSITSNSEMLYSAQETEQTKHIGGEIVSSYAIMVDPKNDRILAEKLGNTRINPASMTKVLTVLVAAEHLKNMEALEDTITMTPEITDYGYVNDCSSAGFERDEVVTVRELFYGTILPSGADAAMGLAVYIAGSHENFVELMNQKLQELGMDDTAHMTNCVGVYDEEHYCTAYDMAMIMEAALDNALCREVMAAKTYTTSITEQHPEGINLSNWFLRRIEDKDTGGEVLCAKTGYVNESGSCAVSYGKDKAGNEYICVTADATSQWKCIADHTALYKEFAQGD